MGIVVSITADPVEGQWVKLRVVYFDILIWYRNDTTMPIVGSKVRVLAIFYADFRYPSGDISIYKGLSWEAVE